MGYGGILKTVFRVAVPIAASAIGLGPIGIALSSAGATAATGGSFKQSLISGATSFVGQSIGSSIGDSLGTSSQVAAANAGAASGAGDLAGIGFDIGAEALAPSFGEQFLSNVPGISSLAGTVGEVAPGFASFADDVGGFFGKTAEGLGITDLGAQGAFGDMTLAALGGKIAGSATALSLDQTVNEALQLNPDALVDSGLFTPEAVQRLSNAARQRQIDDVFTGLQSNVPNPGLPEDEFNRFLSSGLQSINTNLTPDITQSEFDAIFKAPSLGEEILREGFRGQSREIFPNISSGGTPFQPIDSDLVRQLVDRQQQDASGRVANFAARGNLSPLGSSTANEFFAKERPGAEQRVTDLGSSIRDRNTSDLRSIFDRSTNQAGAFTVGGELPFTREGLTTERSNLIGEREGRFADDVRSLLGEESLFNVGQGISAGGKGQGLVSGIPSQQRQIVDRLSEGSRKDRGSRGVGRSGAGAF
jgi:hypothetical protein